ncbi:hypothetical protein [Roseivirga sp.]|uniref:hypothetical protein n=1 Tax=Roseivirga sp. TaxID=1964215 RepID=UPI003B8B9F6F
MKIKDLLSLFWLIGFVNMVIAEIVTLATPRLIQYSIDLLGGTNFSLRQLLLLTIAIETTVGTYLIIRLRMGKIGRLSNTLSASITLLFIITIGEATPGYLVFSIIEAICLLSLILICLINNPQEVKKSGISLPKS